MVGVVGLWMAVEPAHAGTYVMRNCDVPGHESALLGPWYMDPEANVVMADACSTGGGVGFVITGSQLSPGNGATLVLRRPWEGPQREIRLVKVSLWYAARLGGSGQGLNVFSLDFRSGDPPFYSWLVNGPPGAENLSFEQPLDPADTHLYKAGFVCGPISTPRPPEPCVPSHTMPFHVRGIEVTLSEDTPPIVSQPGGTLLAPMPQTQIRTLTYGASDLQSGLAKVDVLLGDTVVATEDLTSRCSYSDWTVCPASRDGSLEIDTRAVANGRHRLTVRVRDAAGNEALRHGERVIEIANESPTALANALPYALLARLTSTTKSTLTVSYGRRASLSGRLTQGSQPVTAGSLVKVLEKSDRRGAKEVSRGDIKTKADGSFSARLVTTRPSRRIRLAYRPAAGGQVVSRTLRLRVRAASSLRATLRGRIVRFSGRVLSGPVPKAGKRVQMEGRSPGSSWTAFKTLRTDRRGRFSGTYRLRVRRPGVKLNIRALVPSEGGYGYLAARSQAVTLRVR